MEPEDFLNDKDQQLLALCRERPMTVNKLATLVGISPASISNKIVKLEQKGLLEVTRLGKGKKTIVKAVKKGATIKYMKEILQKIKREGGAISWKEFSTTPDLYFGAENYFEKSRANSAVLYSDLVERKIHITPKGEKFLNKPNKKN